MLPQPSINHNTSYPVNEGYPTNNRPYPPTLKTVENRSLQRLTNDSFEAQHENKTPKTANASPSSSAKEQGVPLLSTMFIALGSLGLGATVMFVGAKEFNWLGLGQKTKTAVTEAIPQALKSALGANESQTDNEVITIAKNLKQTVTELEEKVTNLAEQLQTKNTETFEENSEGLIRPIFSDTSDEEKLQEYLTKATQDSDAEAQYEVGRYYARGWGTPKNEEEAVKWYRKAATHPTHPNAEAQYQLGRCYLYENGVDEDYQEAIKWYKQAATHATHPNTEAQYQLGNCYYNGLGVSEDKKEAKQWYLKAAENGRDIPRKLKKELGI